MASSPPRRRGYRELIAVVAVQSLGNTMSTSFWLVYLVGLPRALPLSIAVLIWLLAFAIATAVVLVYARGRPVRATTSMTIGLVAMALGHVSLAVLPPALAIVGGAVGFGLYIPAFWLPLNLLFSKETRAANRAGRFAGVTTTFTIVSVGAPALGGSIAQVFGYPVLFATASAVVLANLLLVRRLAQSDETFAFTFDFRRMGVRTSLAFSGQGAFEGFSSAAFPLASFLFTTAALELGLLFALFSLAAGAVTYALGRVSDRVRLRLPFLILGPVLSVPVSLLAFGAVPGDLGTFALAVGALSMTASVAPSFIYTMAADRMEDALPQIAAGRELLLNVNRTVALAIAMALLSVGAGVEILFLLIGGAVLLEAFAR